MYYYVDVAPTVLESYSDTLRERGFDNCPCFNFIRTNWLAPEATDEVRPIDVAFVGTMDRNVSRLRGLELQKLMRLSAEGLNVVVREGVYLDRMLSLYARSKIVWQHSGQGGNNLTFRVSEAMSAGALVLAPRPYDFAGLGDDPIQDGKHLVFYEGFDEARDLMHYYSTHETERARIADAGRRYQLDQRPWVDEVRRFVEEVVDTIPSDFLARRQERLRRHGVDGRQERVDYALNFFMRGAFGLAQRYYEEIPGWAEDPVLSHHQALAALIGGQETGYLTVLNGVLSEHPHNLIVLFNGAYVVHANRTTLGLEHALRVLLQLLEAMQRSTPASWTRETVEGPHTTFEWGRLRLEIVQAHLDYPPGVVRWRRLRQLYVYETRRYLGTVFGECGRWEEAIEMFRGALRIVPDAGYTMAHEAHAWVQLGRLDKAAPLYMRAIELEPFFYSAYDMLAWIWIRAGRAREVIELLGDCLLICRDLCRERAGIYVWLSRASQQLEDLSAAREWLEDAMQEMRTGRLSGGLEPVSAGTLTPEDRRDIQHILDEALEDLERAARAVRAAPGAE
jgi:tetratricopeptide (TPR) repeat protein